LASGFAHATNGIIPTIKADVEHLPREKILRKIREEIFCVSMACGEVEYNDEMIIQKMRMMSMLAIVKKTTSVVITP
jgi:hypothetical protein